MSWPLYPLLVVYRFWTAPIRAEPLAAFRILLGAVMVLALLTGLAWRLSDALGDDPLAPAKTRYDWFERSGRYSLLTGPVGIPFLGKWKLGHRFNLGFLFAMFAGISLLTWLAIADDRHQPEYKLAVQSAERDAERIKLIAKAEGIPLSGAASLLREDAYTQGPKLFARNCANSTPKPLRDCSIRC